MKDGATEHPDVAVIGGGLAGLAAAACVAKAGRPVTVYERSSQLGGRAMTTAQSGFRFNLGPHALYRAGAGARVLRELGVEHSGSRPPLGGWALRDGRLERLPTEPLTTLTTRLFSLGDKIEWGRLAAGAMRIDTGAINGVSLNDWLATRLSRPAVRDFARATVRVTSYANDPDRMSAGAAARQLQLALKGSVDYLDGGWATLVDGQRAAAEQAGVRIVTGARVEAVEGGPRVRFADGATVEPSAAVIAASPGVAAGLAPESASLRRWTAEATPVCAATLDLGLSSLPRPDQRFVLGVDRPLYLSVHSGIANGLAPEGGAMVHVMQYLPPEGCDPPAAERELEALMDLAQPGWRDLVVERRFLPNLVVVNDLATAERGGLPGRPDVAVPDAEGVYLAGDWVGPEGWLSDASLASAERAAAAAVARGGRGEVVARAFAPAGP